MLREGFSVNVKWTDHSKVMPKHSSTPLYSSMTISFEAFQLANQQGYKRLISIVYRNSKLFPIMTVIKGRNFGRGGSIRPEKKKPVKSFVMAGKFKDALIQGLENAVELNFVPSTMNVRNLAPDCVYWDFKANGKFYFISITSTQCSFY